MSIIGNYQGSKRKGEGSGVMQSIPKPPDGLCFIDLLEVSLCNSSVANLLEQVCLRCLLPTGLEKQHTVAGFVLYRFKSMLLVIIV